MEKHFTEVCNKDLYNEFSTKVIRDIGEATKYLILLSAQVALKMDLESFHLTQIQEFLLALTGKNLSVLISPLYYFFLWVFQDRLSLEYDEDLYEFIFNVEIKDSVSDTLNNQQILDFLDQLVSTEYMVSQEKQQSLDELGLRLGYHRNTSKIEGQLHESDLDQGGNIWDKEYISLEFDESVSSITEQEIEKDILSLGLSGDAHFNSADFGFKEGCLRLNFLVCPGGDQGSAIHSCVDRVISTNRSWTKMIDLCNNFIKKGDYQNLKDYKVQQLVERAQHHFPETQPFNDITNRLMSETDKPLLEFMLTYTSNLLIDENEFQVGDYSTEFAEKIIEEKLKDQGQEIDYNSLKNFSSYEICELANQIINTESRDYFTSMELYDPISDLVINKNNHLPRQAQIHWKDYPVLSSLRKLDVLQLIKYKHPFSGLDHFGNKYFFGTSNWSHEDLVRCRYFQIPLYYDESIKKDVLLFLLSRTRSQTQKAIKMINKKIGSKIHPKECKIYLTYTSFCQYNQVSLDRVEPIFIVEKYVNALFVMSSKEVVINKPLLDKTSDFLQDRIKPNTFLIYKLFYNEVKRLREEGISLRQQDYNELARSFKEYQNILYCYNLALKNWDLTIGILPLIFITQYYNRRTLLDKRMRNTSRGNFYNNNQRFAGNQTIITPVPVDNIPSLNATYYLEGGFLTTAALQAIDKSYKTHTIKSTIEIDNVCKNLEKSKVLIDYMEIDHIKKHTNYEEFVDEVEFFSQRFDFRDLQKHLLEWKLELPKLVDNKEEGFKSGITRAWRERYDQKQLFTLTFNRLMNVLDSETTGKPIGTLTTSNHFWAVLKSVTQDDNGACALSVLLSLMQENSLKRTLSNSELLAQGSCTATCLSLFTRDNWPKYRTNIKRWIIDYKCDEEDLNLITTDENEQERIKGFVYLFPGTTQTHLPAGAYSEIKARSLASGRDALSQFDDPSYINVLSYLIREILKVPYVFCDKNYRFLNQSKIFNKDTPEMTELTNFQGALYCDFITKIAGETLFNSLRKIVKNTTHMSEVAVAKLRRITRMNQRNHDRRNDTLPYINSEIDEDRQMANYGSRSLFGQEASYRNFENQMNQEHQKDNTLVQTALEKPPHIREGIEPPKTKPPKVTVAATQNMDQVLNNISKVKPTDKNEKIKSNKPNTKPTEVQQNQTLTKAEIEEMEQKKKLLEATDPAKGGKRDQESDSSDDETESNEEPKHKSKDVLIPGIDLDSSQTKMKGKPHDDNTSNVDGQHLKPKEGGAELGNGEKPVGDHNSSDEDNELDVTIQGGSLLQQDCLQSIRLALKNLLKNVFGLYVQLTDGSGIDGGDFKSSYNVCHHLHDFNRREESLYDKEYSQDR